MDLTQLANLGELIGGVAVIASLLYLAFQVRQNTVHSRAYSQRDMLTEITGDILRILLEPELLRRGLSGSHRSGGDAGSPNFSVRGDSFALGLLVAD